MNVERYMTDVIMIAEHVGVDGSGQSVFAPAVPVPARVWMAGSMMGGGRSGKTILVNDTVWTMRKIKLTDQVYLASAPDVPRLPASISEERQVSGALGYYSVTL